MIIQLPCQHYKHHKHCGWKKKKNFVKFFRFQLPYVQMQHKPTAVDSQKERMNVILSIHSLYCKNQPCARFLSGDSHLHLYTRPGKCARTCNFNNLSFIMCDAVFLAILVELNFSFFSQQSSTKSSPLKKRGSVPRYQKAWITHESTFN